MSQQGIFSIAPDAQANGSANAHSNGASSAGANGSPFAAVSQDAAPSSPFAAVAQESPFQTTQPVADNQRNAIPDRRPAGQPPAMGVAASAEAAVAPEAEANVFEVAEEASHKVGGPFQMNGFSEQQSAQTMEAAPVAPVASREASPFTTVQEDPRLDYEAAKAELEPQQDFAAVQPPQEEPVAGPAPTQPLYTAPAPQQPVQAAPATSVLASAPAPVAAAPAPIANSASQFQQLELRAIFGIDHVLGVNEILQRARTLPGIRNVSVVGSEEGAALSNFRQAMSSLGLGDSQELKLSTGGGSIDFLSEGETTVAVLHEGAYAPGVQETLIIVAREIGKLS